MNINKLLLISIIFFVLLVGFALAQTEQIISFQLLNPEIGVGIWIINTFLAVLVVIFTTLVSRSSATSSQYACGFIVISTIFLTLLTVNQALKSLDLLQIGGLKRILLFLFLIFLLIGLYKLRRKNIDDISKRSTIYQNNRFKYG